MYGICIRYALLAAMLLDVICASKKPNIVIFLADDLVSLVPVFNIW